MQDWKRAEKIVKDSVGGSFTIGSGNKSRKGDVKAGKSGYGDWCIEVKQTSIDSIQLQSSWLLKLEKELDSRDVALVLFFGLKPIAVIPTEFRVGKAEFLPWKTTKVKFESLPPFVYSPSGRAWEFISLSELSNVVKSGNEIFKTSNNRVVSKTVKNKTS